MNKPKEFKLGWLSPDGELVECNSFDHISSASEICDKLGYSYTKEKEAWQTEESILIVRLFFFRLY